LVEALSCFHVKAAAMNALPDDPKSRQAYGKLRSNPHVQL
jgi:hypothetical protein